MLLSCMHLAAKLRELHRLNLAATLSQSIPRQMSSIQGKQTCLVQQSCHSASFLASSQQQTPAVFSGKLEEQAGPNISRLAPHLQQEWDYKAKTHLGKIIIAPHSLRKAWWRSGMCKIGQPHRWQARVSDRTNGAGCPYDSGRAVRSCNNLAHKPPRGGSGVGLECQQGKDTRDCDSKQRSRGGLEVWLKRQQLDHRCLSQN